MQVTCTWCTILVSQYQKLHSFVDPNNSAINGADMDHILAAINDERNPGKANPNEHAQQKRQKISHGTRLVANLSCDLKQK